MRVDSFFKTLAKYAAKEMLPVIFSGACVLAKLFPIFPDGNFKGDAVLYLLIGGLLYFAWDHAR